MKLFTLMGGTWLMEFVSWAIDDQGVILTIFDAVNILRGPIIFYLCVIGNSRVRKAIMSRFKLRVNPARCSLSTINSDLTSGNTADSCSKWADTAL
jgi:hypothetical protein